MKTVTAIIFSLFMAILPLCFNSTSVDAQDKHQTSPAKSDTTTTSPLNDSEIVSLADCIIKLQPRTTPFVAKFMAMHIIKEGKAKKLDPDLITSQIFVESEFNPNATSNMQARGLMQVRYEVWKDSPLLKDNGVDAKHKIYWIDANIQSGTDILKKFMDESNGNIAVALNRYWTGNPKLDKKPWENTYVSRILYYYFKIREHRLNGTPLEAEEIAAAPAVEISPKHIPASAGGGKAGTQKQ